MGKWMLCAAAALAPQISLFKLKFMIPLILTSHYEDADVNIYQKYISLSSPSTNCLKECLLEIATYTLVQLRNELDGNIWVYLLFDKGDQENLCKRLAWWSKEEQKVKIILLGVYRSGGSSKDCALAIFHIKRKLWDRKDLLQKLLEKWPTVVGEEPFNWLLQNLDFSV